VNYPGYRHVFPVQAACRASLSFHASNNPLLEISLGLRGLSNFISGFPEGGVPFTLSRGGSVGQVRK
jgi:hypothetical protein